MPHMTGPGVPAPRWTTYIRLSDLRPAVRNPKKHCLPDIVASIQRFGFINSVTMCDRTNRLAAGHGRMAALVHMKQAGDQMPDGLVMDDDGEWCVPAERGWASRNDAELEAYIIADNKLTENGGWDDRLTAEMLHDIHANDPSLFETVGFTADEMDDLFATVDPELWDKDPDALPSGGGGLTDDSDDEGTGAKPRPAAVTCPECGHGFIPGKDAS